ncbi:MAG: TonB-dependent receptor [Gammaproteobacteria bacterium]|nr:MAG: TonB-dependent receptor [Gammaproteobacteria bacterium]
MKKAVSKPATTLNTLACIGLLGLTANCYAEDIGTIRVESSTIDDRNIDWRSEPSSVAVITGDEVDEAHAENIQQMLQSIPGVTTELQGGDSLKIHIRGVDNNRFMGEKPGVAVVIDGVPVFERTGKVNIDLDNIETIRVIKGGASFLFGEDALSGAVIITTKRGAKYAGYKLAAEAGSFGYRKGLVRAGAAEDDYSFHVQASTRSTDGYHFQSDYTADYLNGKLQYYIDDASDMTFGFEYSERDKDSHGTVTGVTQAETDPESVEGRDYARMFDVTLGKYYLTYNNDMADNKNLMVNVYQFTDDTEYKSAPVRYDASGAVVTDVNAYTTHNDYAQIQRGLKSELRGSGSRLAWLGGVDVRDNSYDNYALYITDFRTSAFSPVYTAGTVVGDNVTDEMVYAAYGEIKYSVTNDTVLTLNGRHDDITLDYSDNIDALLNGKESFNINSWRLGANHQLKPNLGIYATVSTGFRAPTAEELFYGDNNLGNAVDPNRNLDPEETLNKEIGLHAQTLIFDTSIDIDIALFELDRKNFIMPSSGQYAPAGSSGVSSFENIGGARHRGLELSMRTDASKTWSFNLAYTYLDAVFTDYDNFWLSLGNPYNPFDPYADVLYNNTGNEVPRVPRNHINLTTVYRVSEMQILTAEIDAISSYYADEINQEKIDGHCLLHLLWNYDVKQGDKVEWSLFARIDNVFDKFYYNTARGFYDANYDGVYDAEDLSIVVNQGRTYTAGAEVRF